MTTSVELVPLKCLHCGVYVPAEEEEVAWACQQCGQGMQLTAAGLAQLTVNWAAARKKDDAVQWRPFWVFEGTVNLIRRETYGGGGVLATLTSLVDPNAPDKLWNVPRRFYVPAFPASLEKIETLGADLTRKQVALKAGPAAGVLSDCTLFPDDARQAVEFVVLTIEADRKDRLREVDFNLNLGEPELWVLPFEGKDEVGELALTE